MNVETLHRKLNEMLYKGKALHAVTALNPMTASYEEVDGIEYKGDTIRLRFKVKEVIKPKLDPLAAAKITNDAEVRIK